jgi:hypothetical protein
MYVTMYADMIGILEVLLKLTSLQQCCETFNLQNALRNTPMATPLCQNDDYSALLLTHHLFI